MFSQIDIYELSLFWCLLKFINNNNNNNNNELI